MPALTASIYLLTHPLDITLVTDEEGRAELVMGYALHPETVASNFGFDKDGEEVVTHTPGEGMLLNKVVVDYSFPIEITYDGESKTVHTHEMSVLELLEKHEVEITEHDFSEPSFNEPIIEGDNIELFRVHYEIEEITDVIEHDVNIRETSLLNRRHEDVVVLLEGVDGEGTLTYENKFINGEMVDSVLIEEDLISDPITEEQIVYAPVPVSDLTEGFENYPIVDGVPQNYKSMIPASRATGYYSATGRGSSGLGLFYGSCAVNPNIIPYGSKLYIASAEGDSFVYGYAIATDTGTAMMEGHAIVDLFYETYRESAINGVRIVDVYILE